MSVKILHILKSAGGVEVAVRMITQHTNPEKITHIIAHDDKSKIYHDKNNNRIKDYLIPIKRELKIIKDIQCFFTLLKIIREEKPNKVHCHSSKAGLIGRFIGLITKLQIIYTPHAFSYLSTQNKLKKAIYIAIEKYTKFQKSTFFLATSNSERERAINDIKYKIDNTDVWNNSIRPIEVNEKLEQFTNYQYICTVGRPSYQKNIEMLIQAINLIKDEFPDLYLKIIGAGYYSPNTTNLVTLINKFQLQDRVEIIEWCERNEALNYIKNAEFVVSTARYEGLPISIIESLGLGKATIATNVDGNKDLILNDYNGFLVSNEDYKELASKIRTLLKDSKLKLTFENNGLKYFNNNFNVLNNIYKIEEIYIF